jgi:hypothetical protein
MRPRGSKKQSEDQRLRHAALLQFQAQWRMNYNHACAKWKEFVKTMPWTNRLGVRRGISGYNAYLAYMQLIYPYGVGLQYTRDPPLSITTPTPIILGVSFTGNGACTITTQDPPSIYLYENLTLQIGLQYGPRTSSGSTHWAGSLSVDSETMDWSTEINARAIDLTPGDVIKLRIFWVISHNWPSQNAEWTTTVL